MLHLTKLVLLLQSNLTYQNHTSCSSLYTEKGYGNVGSNPIANVYNRLGMAYHHCWDVHECDQRYGLLVNEASQPYVAWRTSLMLPMRSGTYGPAMTSPVSLSGAR